MIPSQTRQNKENTRPAPLLFARATNLVYHRSPVERMKMAKWRESHDQSSPRSSFPLFRDDTEHPYSNKYRSDWEMLNSIVKNPFVNIIMLPILKCVHLILMRYASKVGMVHSIADCHRDVWIRLHLSSHQELQIDNNRAKSNNSYTGRLSQASIRCG